MSINLSLRKYENKEGYFALNNNGVFNSWSYFNCNELEQADQHIRLNKLLDSFNSIATFNTAYRNSNNIKLVLEHYIDIDNHLSPFTEQQAQDFLENVLKPNFDIAMPVPSQVVFSGRGLHLHFNLVDGCDLIKWQYTQQALLERVQSICYKENILLNASGLEIDSSCRDSARVLRTIGTMNTKANTFTKVLFRDDRANYTQEEIARDYNLQWTETRGKNKGLKHDLKLIASLNKDDILKASQRELKGFMVYNKLYSRETLNQARKNDLFKIIELRNSACINEGYRNNLLSIAVQLMRESTNDINKLFNELLELNEYFNSPLTESQVKSWCLSASKKQMYFSNKYIIEKLNISRAEQQQLSTIISRQVKNNRYYLKNQDLLKYKQFERYRFTKEINRANKRGLIKKAQEMAKNGIKAETIAKELGISRATYFRYLKG